MTLTDIILLAAKKAGVSGALLLAVCAHESSLRNVKTSHDGKGTSYGVCQVKAATAQQMGFKGKPELLMNPRTNAKYAALYLKFQMDRYDDNMEKAIAAYNAGSFNESKILRGRPRNLRYTRTVLAFYKKFKEKYEPQTVKGTNEI